MTWYYKTKKGIFYIAPMNDGKFHIIYDDTSLGGYPTPHQAAEEIANGYCFWPSCGDPEELNIPEELDDWTRKS